MYENSHYRLATDHHYSRFIHGTMWARAPAHVFGKKKCLLTVSTCTDVKSNIANISRDAFCANDLCVWHIYIHYTHMHTPFLICFFFFLLPVNKKYSDRSHVCVRKKCSFGPRPNEEKWLCDRTQWNKNSFYDGTQWN